MDCEEEENVGVIKCGGLDLSVFSFSPGFSAEMGESRD